MIYVTKQIARIGFTISFVGSGLAHFFKPHFYIPLIPELMPWRLFWVYSSGVVELLLAVGLWCERWKKLAAQGTFLLMLLFFPLHLADTWREKPVAGGRTDIALVRLLAQFGMIALAKSLTQADDSK